MTLEEKNKDLKMKWFTFGVLFGLFFGFFLAVGLILEYPDIIQTNDYNDELNGSASDETIYDRNEIAMAELLRTQFDLLDELSFICDIDIFTQYHSEPICLAKIDIITPLEIGYVLHENTISGAMWVDEDSPNGYMKMKGSNDSAQEYDGNVRLIKLDDVSYYLITNASLQEKGSQHNSDDVSTK